MVKGYILVKLVPGLEPEALSQIRAIPGVVDVNLVFGQWDSEIRSIQGVQDTTTLVQGEL